MQQRIFLRNTELIKKLLEVKNETTKIKVTEDTEKVSAPLIGMIIINRCIITIKACER